MRSIVREHPALALFTLGYFLGFVAFGVARGRAETPVYMVAVALAMLLVARIHARVHLSTGTLWGLAVWGGAHMAGGLIAWQSGTLYNRPLGIDFVRYDRVVHAFGFGFGTLVAWEALRALVPAVRRLTPGVGVLVVLTGIGIGAVNEVIEFFTTLVGAGANVGGYDNTGWDLVFDTLGAVAAIAWVALRQGRGTGGSGSSDISRERDRGDAFAD